MGDLGLPPPPQPISAESINNVQFYKELFGKSFAGMDVFMRNQIIGNMTIRAQQEGFDPLNTENASILSEFFRTRGRFTSVAQETILNHLRSLGLGAFPRPGAAYFSPRRNRGFTDLIVGSQDNRANSFDALSISAIAQQ